MKTRESSNVNMGVRIYLTLITLVLSAIVTWGVWWILTFDDWNNAPVVVVLAIPFWFISFGFTLMAYAGTFDNWGRE